MSFKLIYHPDVRDIDIPKLDKRAKERIRRAIESRLEAAQQQYGEPLRKTLKGYWKLRVGDYRVVFKITKSEVWIFGIIHRKEIYDRIKRHGFVKTLKSASLVIPANPGSGSGAGAGIQ